MLSATKSGGNDAKKISPESHADIQLESGVGGFEGRQNGREAGPEVRRSPRSDFAVEEAAAEPAGVVFDGGRRLACHCLHCGNLTTGES